MTQAICVYVNKATFGLVLKYFNRYTLILIWNLEQ